MSMIAVLRAASAEDLTRALADTTTLERILDSESEMDSPQATCYLDQTWHAIHFLLTGDEEDTESPLARAILGSAETGLMLPAGPVMVSTPEDVRSCATALSAISRETIASRYSAEALSLAKIHPNDWEQYAEAPQHVLDDYEMLVRFYEEAASGNKAVIVSIG